MTGKLVVLVLQLWVGNDQHEVVVPSLTPKECALYRQERLNIERVLGNRAVAFCVEEESYYASNRRPPTKYEDRVK